jgi:Secretion system C-terminal sorting domain
MKTKTWQLCLLLLISPLLLFAQVDGDIISTDTASAPITATPFISFQAQTRDNKIFIQWQVGKDSAEYFTIEKSIEGKIYETIGVLKCTENLLKYEFADEFPSRGQAYYRVRYTAKNGVESYSTPVTVLMPGSTFFRFYPNPADNLLIIRAEGPVELQIADGFGKQRISKSLGSGPQVIDVSFLEKGVYILRITDKSTGRQQLEKFLKN